MEFPAVAFDHVTSVLLPGKFRTCVLFLFLFRSIRFGFSGGYRLVNVSQPDAFSLSLCSSLILHASIPSTSASIAPRSIHRPLKSKSKFPSRYPQFLTAEDMRIALASPPNATSARPPRWACHSTSRTTCTAPRKSTLFGIIFCWIRILLFEFLSYVPLSSFRLIPPFPYASFPSFNLAFGYRTSLHLFRPCARHLALGYNSLNCLPFEHRILLSTSPCGSVASRTDFTLLSFLLISPLYLTWT